MLDGKTYRTWDRLGKGRQPIYSSLYCFFSSSHTLIILTKLCLRTEQTRALLSNPHFFIISILCTSKISTRAFITQISFILTNGFSEWNPHITWKLLQHRWKWKSRVNEMNAFHLNCNKIRVCIYINDEITKARSLNIHKFISFSSRQVPLAWARKPSCCPDKPTGSRTPSPPSPGRSRPRWPRSCSYLLRRRYPRCKFCPSCEPCRVTAIHKVKAIKWGSRVVAGKTLKGWALKYIHTHIPKCGVFCDVIISCGTSETTRRRGRLWCGFQLFSPFPFCPFSESKGKNGRFIRRGNENPAPNDEVHREVKGTCCRSAVEEGKNKLG